MATSIPLPRPEDDHELDPQQTKLEAADPMPADRSRPFVIAGRVAGSGGSDKTTRMVLMMLGGLLLGIAFFALISTKGSHKSKNAAEQSGKPSLGRVITLPPPVSSYRKTRYRTRKGAKRTLERWKHRTSRKPRGTL